jgi:hypothetical protein
MIGLFLSSDDKHTVHLAGGTANQTVKLQPNGQTLRDVAVHQYGTGARM